MTKLVVIALDPSPCWFLTRCRHASIVGRDVAFLLSEGQILVRSGCLQGLTAVGTSTSMIFYGFWIWVIICDQLNKKHHSNLVPQLIRFYELIWVTQLVWFVNLGNMSQSPVIWVKQCHEASPSHHHRWYVYRSQSRVVTMTLFYPHYNLVFSDISWKVAGDFIGYEWLIDMMLA